MLAVAVAENTKRLLHITERKTLLLKSIKSQASKPLKQNLQLGTMQNEINKVADERFTCNFMIIQVNLPDVLSSSICSLKCLI